MRVAVSAAGPGLDSPVDPRFGRCPYFIIVDTDTMEYEAVPNTSQYAASGAGIQAAQTIAGRGVKAVLTGNVGPNAFQALSSAGIQIITGVTGTVREAVTKYKEGNLGRAGGPTAPMRYGMGGFGMGMGRGGGQGMGRRMGRFGPPAYANVPSVAPFPQMTKEQEIQMLQNRMEMLQSQLDQIKKRLKELKAEEKSGEAETRDSNKGE
ncbi:MAG: hypothetical protein AYL33_000200 [Candidatus Bathyarchaeota archaeon B63]|nr:MAG: hypothetical protein AYL33_000200 [Candidatus Bathyarchaeota archaeon B63]